MRITITDIEATELKKLINSRAKVKLGNVVKEIEDQENKGVSDILLNAAANARAKRTENIKKKLEKVINYLVMYHPKDISDYKISQESKVSYKTVKKLISDERLKQINKAKNGEKEG